MNFLRRLLRRKTRAWTHVVARSEQDAIKEVWLHGGLSSLDEAIDEKRVHGGEVYCICISVQHKIKVIITEDWLDGTIQKDS